MEIILRPDQQALKSDIYGSWNAGHQNVLAQLPTGGGKSIVVSDITLDGARDNMGQAIIAHRNELVGQMSLHIANRGIYHRIIGADKTIAQITRNHRKKFNGHSFINPSARTAVAGVDTLVQRRDELAAWALQINRWIIDEAHHVLRENKWGKAVSMFKNAHGLGVSATPGRPDGQGLGRHTDGVFDDLVSGLTMRQLINMGALCDYEIVCPPSDLVVDDSDVGASGDWGSAKLKAAAKKSKIVGCVVENYKKYAMGKQAICFATDVETSGSIAAKFNDSGIRAASLSAKTPPTVREKFIEEFKTGVLTVLVNVDLFDEGFDCPACEVVIMARPTASIVKYLQMFGRALRTSPGKAFGLIIDHVGNVKRHKFPDMLRLWSLDRRDKRAKVMKSPDDIELTTCKGCARPYERFMTFCPHCGMMPPLPDPRSRTVEMVDGDLILLDRAMLERMRAATTLEGIADIGERVKAAAGGIAGKGAMNKHAEKHAAQERLKHVIAQWAGIERLRGFNDSQIHKKFFITMNATVLDVLAASNTRQDFEEMATTIERWYM